jgi:integrase
VKPCFEDRLRQQVPGRIGTAAQLWLTVLQVEHNLAASTRYEYHKELSLVGEMFPEKEPADFDKLTCQMYFAHRCLGKSENSRRKYMAILGGFFRYLHDLGQISQNPMATIKRPPAPEPDPTFWEPDQIARLLSAPLCTRDHVLLEVLARHGQRMGVVRTLTWDRVLLDTREPEIRYPKGKGGKFHALPLDRELIHDLTVLRRTTNPDPQGLVFSSNQGKPLSPQQINRIIEKACRLAGVRRASAHEFRRSCITNMSMAGVDLAVISKGVANHASPATTLRHYRTVHRTEVARALRSLPY